jgi:hypothetical protein
MCGHQTTLVARAIQHVAIGVMDRTSSRLPMRDRHAQRSGDQRLIVAIGHGQLTILREHKSISSAR